MEETNRNQLGGAEPNAHTPKRERLTHPSTPAPDLTGAAPKKIQPGATPRRRPRRVSPDERRESSL